MDYIISKIGLANTIVFVCCVYSSILYSIVSNKLKNLLSVARYTRRWRPSAARATPPLQAGA